MKTLYESILDTEKDYDNDVLISILFSKDIQQRRDAFESLLDLITSYGTKQHTKTAKMKRSDSYFIEFTWPIKIEKGEAAEILDWISYIQICKRIGSFYRTICINTSGEWWRGKVDEINVFEQNWDYTRANFAPHAQNSKLYEVPEELNELFEQIQIEAHKHKKR